MADAHHLLSWNPAVGHDAYQGRHEDAGDALHGVEHSDVGTLSGIGQIAAHRCQISSPHGKLQEVHNDQSEFNVLHILIIL